jgi:hypothetical protein
MEPEGSSPHSQMPANCPYPEPAQSSPYPPHPTSWRSSLILSSHLSLGLPSDLVPSGFPTKTLYTPPSSPNSTWWLQYRKLNNSQIVPRQSPGLAGHQTHTNTISNP